MQGGYRPDVDGLRALAVLSVIVYHVSRDLLPGGFVGVDIFFVISGYLITANILRELELGRFSVAEFYRRRIKRIAPPMLIVTAATVVIAQAIMLPEDAERVAEGGIWSLASAANVYFWLHLDTSYFAAASNEAPLLHLWSLGVEEQFYLAWPLLLMVAYRARLFVAAVIVVAVASFALGELAFPHSPAFVYYMLPTRAGELMVGALAAIAVARQIRMPAGLAALLAWGGIALVAASFFMVRDDRPFPGLLAVPPTLGVACVILAGHASRGAVTRALSTRPLVWIGLVSYSAYLWHWPILAFYRYGHPGVDLDIGVAAAAVATTFLLAYLTYRYVETPARATKAGAARVFAVQYALPACAIAAFAAVVMYADGYVLRGAEYRARLEAIRDTVRPAYHFDYVCQRKRVTVADIEDDRCVLGSGGRSRVLLWGDSNAAHLVGMFGAVARQAGFRFRNVAVDACPPLLTGAARFVASARVADCEASAEPIRRAIDAADVVIIAGSWLTYTEHSPDFLDALFRTVKQLTDEGKRVVLVGKAPVMDGFDRRCAEKALAFPALECPPVLASPMQPEIAALNDRLASFADREETVEYFDPGDYLCKGGMCAGSDEIGPLYYDVSHFSMPASWRIGERIIRSHGVPKAFADIGRHVAPKGDTRGN